MTKKKATKKKEATKQKEATKKKDAPAARPSEVDVLATLLGELEDGVARLRPHYLDEDDSSLKSRVVGMLDTKWRSGNVWPSNKELAERAEAERTERERCEKEFAEQTD